MESRASEELRRRVSAAGIKSGDDLLDWLQDQQNKTEPEAIRRALGAAACLTVALVGSGAVAMTALVLCFLASVAFVWTLVDYTGRRWFIHHVLFQEVIRPRPNLAVELVDAMIRLDDAAQAVREAHCEEQTGERWDGAADAQGGRYSDAHSAPEGVGT